MDDHRTKAIIHNKVGAKARKCLLAIYQSYQYSQKDVSEAITAINEGIQQSLSYAVHQESLKMKKAAEREFDRMLKGYKKKGS
jgi:hypothetical protein